MLLPRLAAYVSALERRGWRAWVTGRDGILNLHAAVDDREGVVLRFLVADQAVHEPSLPPAVHRGARELEARLLEHAAHTAAFALIRAGDPESVAEHGGWVEHAPRGVIAPFAGRFDRVDLPAADPLLADALDAALAGLDTLDPVVSELVAVLDAFEVDAPRAGVRVVLDGGAGTIGVSLRRRGGIGWSWLTLRIERAGVVTERFHARITDPAELRAWLEARVISSEGRWIAADLRSSRTRMRWPASDALLVPGIPRTGRTAWSDRVEALLDPVPATEVGLACLQAVRAAAEATAGRAWAEAMDGPDAWWVVKAFVGPRVGRARFLVSGDEVVPPIGWPADPAEWVARLVRRAGTWTPSQEVAAVLADAAVLDIGFVGWWVADADELELRVRRVDSGELVASVARIAFPVDPLDLRERIAAELDGTHARLVIRELVARRGGARVFVGNSAAWVDRDAYRALFDQTVRAVGPRACSLVLHDAADAMAYLRRSRTLELGGIEVRATSLAISGADVVLEGTARFAAEDGRLTLGVP